MSEQDVNDSMVPVASEVPGQSGTQAAPDSNVHAKPAPSMGENIFAIAAVPMDDGGGEWKPLDESAWHPKELSPDMQRQLPFLDGSFAPRAYGAYVHSPDGEVRELSDVVGDIIGYMRDSRYGVHPYYPMNDIGISRLFADTFKYALRYVSEAKQWYVYDYEKGIWYPSGNEAMEYCKDFIQMLRYHVDCLNKIEDNVGKRISSFVNKLQSRKARETILKDAASVHAISITKFDENAFTINCINGTLKYNAEKKDWQLYPHRATDFLTKSTKVKYRKEIDCPRWRKHIEEIMLGDKELEKYLQKAFGYALTGDTHLNCFFIFFGPTTRNGKSVTLETVMEILGDYARSASPATITQKKNMDGSAPSEDIARLAGARLVAISEPGKKMVLSSALMKTLTGNDTVVARYLFQNSFEYTPTYKIFINTNHLPTVVDDTIFTSGRARVILFPRHLEPHEQDSGLKQEFVGQEENRSGIFNWCMEGLRALCKEGLEAPEAVKKSIEEYQQKSSTPMADEGMQESNPIACFVKNVLEVNLGSEVRITSAYGRYCEWCEENGYDTCSLKMFHQRMEEYVKIVKKRPIDKSGKNPVSMIIGYKFKND